MISLSEIENTAVYQSSTDLVVMQKQSDQFIAFFPRFDSQSPARLLEVVNGLNWEKRHEFPNGII